MRTVEEAKRIGVKIRREEHLEPYAEVTHTKQDESDSEYTLRSAPQEGKDGV